MNKHNKRRIMLTNDSTKWGLRPYLDFKTWIGYSFIATHLPRTTYIASVNI